MTPVPSISTLLIAGLTPVANTVPYFDSANTAALATLTPFARTLLDDADNTAARATLAAAGLAVVNTFTTDQRIDGNVGVGVAPALFSGSDRTVLIRAPGTSKASTIQVANSDGSKSLTLYSGFGGADNPTLIWNASTPLRFGTSTNSSGTTGYVELLRFENTASGVIVLPIGTDKSKGITQNSDTHIWRQAAGMWGIGDSAVGSGVGTARHGLFLGQGGYSAPGVFQVDTNGDKIILYRGDAYDARVGVGSSANMWFLSGTASAGGGVIEFYTAASSGSATKQVTIGHNTIGFFGVTPIAKPAAAAAATDAATTQTLANSLRTILINLGLAS